MVRHDIQRVFTKRYIVAISLIALLSTVAYAILHMALKTSDSTALVVNISGKQRMLSQRIASLSQQYHTTIISEQSKNGDALIRPMLERAIEEMHLSNIALSTGKLNQETTVVLSDEIQRFYYGDIHLAKRVEEYLTLAKTVLSTTDPQERSGIVNELTAISNTLLPDLHAAVLQYQKEGEENISNIKSLESLAWVLTLITLMLEVIFIFQPMAHKIGELFGEIRHHEETLEQQIQMRTLSLEQANVKLEKLATHDPLTGLRNRLNFERHLELLLEHYHSHHVPFALILIDIDWFKKVNDTYGHDVGDEILKQLAVLIKNIVREEDKAYRIGGEEFVILFNRITKEDAIARAEEFRKTVKSHPFHINDLVLNITISGGIYFPNDKNSEDPTRILKCADAALYKAKRSGRDQLLLCASS